MDKDRGSRGENSGRTAYGLRGWGTDGFGPIKGVD